MIKNNQVVGTRRDRQIAKEDFEKMNRQLDLLSKESEMVRRYRQKMSVDNLEELI